MNSTYRQIVAAVIAVLILIGLGALSTKVAQRYPVTNRRPTTQTIQASPQTISYKGENSKNALELLKRNHRVETKDSSFGVFVTSIDGVAQTDQSAWLYYVDGQIGQEAADKFVTSDNQTIEWRYENLSNL